MNAWSVVRRNPIVCALALLSGMALIFVSEGAYRQSLATLEQLAIGQQQRSDLREAQIGMLDAESAKIGYLLTGRKAYLEPYAQGQKQASESLGDLERSYRDARVQSRLAALRLAVVAKQAEMAQTIRLHDGGQTQAALALAAGDAGMAQMDTIRRLTAELLALDTEARAQKGTQLRSTLMLSRVGVASLTLIGLVALLMYLRHGQTLQAHAQALKSLAEAERTRLEAEVQQRTAELTDLTRHLQTAREDERNRLARDLHDELGSLLTSAKLDAARIKSRLGDTAPEAQERLAHLVATLNSSIVMGRRIIEDLRPSTLANLGLVAALEILAREFGERSGLQMHCALEPVALSAPAALVVYRLVQEAITNLSKHAQASQVWITLRELGGRAEASVRDDGVGFDTTTPPASAYGLLGMRYRVEAESGRLAVESAPGRGTTVSLSLPLAA